MIKKYKIKHKYFLIDILLLISDSHSEAIAEESYVSYSYH